MERQVNMENATKIHSPWSEATGAINWQEHLKGNFDKLLGAESILAKKWETTETMFLGEVPQFDGL